MTSCAIIHREGHTEVAGRRRNSPLRILSIEKCFVEFFYILKISGWQLEQSSHSSWILCRKDRRWYPACLRFKRKGPVRADAGARPERLVVVFIAPSFSALTNRSRHTLSLSDPYKFLFGSLFSRAANLAYQVLTFLYGTGCNCCPRILCAK